MDIGKTIRKSREKLGLSQKDLAKALGILPLTSAAVYPQGRIIGVLDPAWIVR